MHRNRDAAVQILQSSDIPMKIPLINQVIVKIFFCEQEETSVGGGRVDVAAL